MHKLFGLFLQEHLGEKGIVLVKWTRYNRPFYFLDTIINKPVWNMETDIQELNKRHFLSHARQPEVKPFSFQ